MRCYPLTRKIVLFFVNLFCFGAIVVLLYFVWLYIKYSESDI